MRRDFCDRCETIIVSPTMANKVALPDDRYVDLCSGCAKSLRELLRKWQETFK